MKKYLLISILFLSTVFQANAQSKGVKIGYIDMEYILQNVPDYSEAKKKHKNGNKILKQKKLKLLN
jgi:Skp family chaperone for outer membrane proteins